MKEKLCKNCIHFDRAITEYRKIKNTKYIDSWGSYESIRKDRELKEPEYSTLYGVKPNNYGVCLNFTHNEDCETDNNVLAGRDTEVGENFGCINFKEK